MKHYPLRDGTLLVRLTVNDTDTAIIRTRNLQGDRTLQFFALLIESGNPSIQSGNLCIQFFGLALALSSFFLDSLRPRLIEFAKKCCYFRRSSFSHAGRRVPPLHPHPKPTEEHNPRLCAHNRVDPLCSTKGLRIVPLDDAGLFMPHCNKSPHLAPAESRLKLDYAEAKPEELLTL